MICYSLGFYGPVDETEADALLDLITYRSQLEQRYAYFIMHTDMCEHASTLRDGHGKRFYQQLEGQPHWAGIPIIIDDYALKPVYLIIMPVMLFSGYLSYPRETNEIEDNRMSLEDRR